MKRILGRYLPTLGTSVALAFCYVQAARAQVVYEAQFSAQPLIYMKDGGINGCGVRVMAVYVSNDLNTTAMDVSVNIHVGPMVVFKGSAFEMGPPGQTKPVQVPVEIQSIWVKARNQNATHPLQGKIRKGEDGHSLLYGTTTDSVLAVMFSTVNKDTITIGFKRKGRSNEQIYTGVARLTSAESDEFSQCIAELHKRLDVSAPQTR